MEARAPSRSPWEAAEDVTFPPPAGEAEPAEALPRQACIPQHSHLPGQACASTSHHTARGRRHLQGIPESHRPSARDVDVFPREGASDLPFYPLPQGQAIPFLVFILAESGEGSGGGFKTGRKPAFSLAGVSAPAGRRAVAPAGRDTASPPGGICPPHT